MSKKILKPLVLAVTLTVFMALQSGYALETMKRPETSDNQNAQKTAKNIIKEEGNKDTPNEDKKSVYNGIGTLISNGKFAAGTEFEYSEYKKDRIAYGKTLPDVGEEGAGDYSISDSMLEAELNSMILMGVVQRVSKGKYRVVVSMTAEQRDEIDRRFQAEIAPLSRKDAGLNRSIGLNAYTLMNLSDEDMSRIKHIVGQVLLTGRVIETASKDSPLEGVAYERVVVLTEGQVKGKLRKDVIATKIVGLGANKKLVIAGSTKINYDKGTLTKASSDYIDGILRGLPIEYTEAKRLFEDKVIVFSYIDDQTILADIENVAVYTSSTLDNLAPSVAITLV